MEREKLYRTHSKFKVGNLSSLKKHIDFGEYNVTERSEEYDLSESFVSSKLSTVRDFICLSAFSLMCKKE